MLSTSAKYSNETPLAAVRSAPPLTGTSSANGERESWCRRRHCLAEQQRSSRAPSHSSAVTIAADSAAGRCALAQGARAKFERTMTKIAARGGGGGDNGAVSSSGEMAAVRAPS